MLEAVHNDSGFHAVPSSFSASGKQECSPRVVYLPTCMFCVMLAVGTSGTARNNLEQFNSRKNSGHMGGRSGHMGGRQIDGPVLGTLDISAVL